MSNIGIAFKILERGETQLQGYNKSSGHMIYTFKMEFTRNLDVLRMDIEIQILNPRAMQELF